MHQRSSTAVALSPEASAFLSGSICAVTDAGSDRAVEPLGRNAAGASFAKAVAAEALSMQDRRSPVTTARARGRRFMPGLYDPRLVCSIAVKCEPSSCAT